MPIVKLTARERKAGLDLRNMITPHVVPHRSNRVRSNFKVEANLTGVRFAIDQQSFNLHIEHGWEEDVLTRNRWYANQLRKALARLQAAMGDPPRLPRQTRVRGSKRR